MDSSVKFIYLVKSEWFISWGILLVRYGLPKIKDILPVESGSLKFKGFTCGIWVAQDQRFYLWNLGRLR